MTDNKEKYQHSSQSTIAVPVIEEFPQLSLEDSLILYTVLCKQYTELKILVVESAALRGWSHQDL